MTTATSDRPHERGRFSFGTALLAAFDLLVASPTACALIVLNSPPQGFSEKCASMAALVAAATAAAAGICLLGDLWRARPRLRLWAVAGQFFATCSFGLVILTAVTAPAGGDMGLYTRMGNLLLAAIALPGAVISFAGLVYLWYTLPAAGGMR